MVRDGGADDITEPNGTRPSPADAASADLSLTERSPRPFRGETDPMALAQDYLSGTLQVFEIHLLHGQSKFFILDRNIKFVVSDPTRDVQVGRSHSCPTTVGNGRLGMDHGPVPFKDTDTRFEQRLVAGPGELTQDRNVC